MHELSIAMSIVEIAAAELRQQGGTGVVGVHLRVGAWSGVAREALQSAFELARVDTALDCCRLQIEEVAVAMHCPACQCERVVVSPDDPRCGVCGSTASEFVRGRELEIVALEIET